MKTSLSDIATIQTGLFAQTILKGDTIYLQSKHFDENGHFIQNLEPNLKADYITNKHLLKHGDILFSAKGTKNFAAWYESKNTPAVASTSFFVIRLRENFSDKIFPEFLVWYINNPASQKLLKGKAIGTSIVSISKPVLEELKVSIPDLETQKAILQIANLYKEEKKIKQQIDKLREQQIQQQIINSINL